MKQKITPLNITKLKKNEVFVFGSNLAGNHAGGAAKFALDKFGAIHGNSSGIQGKSYAIPTLGKQFEKLDLSTISQYVDIFNDYAIRNTNTTFLITDIGCGIAGFTPNEIAPMFTDVVGKINISLPQSFLDAITKNVKKGYKVTKKDMTCNPDGKPFKFELGVIHHVDGHIVPCRNGIHYCEELRDCFSYYDFDPSNRVFEIEDYGTTVKDGNKSCTSDIKLIRELSWIEVLKLVNQGTGNSGLGNAGNYNAGYNNAGNYNAGNYNAGNYNAGNYNAGNYNAGNRNAGNYNAGYNNAGNYNAGNYNAGNYNAGNYNAGNYNAGNRNAGYNNAGNDNAGAFNNLQANYVMFNKPSTWKYEDYINSTAYRYNSQICTTLWVPDYQMTDEEKKNNPYYVTTRGFNRQLDYKECFQNAWNNWSEDVKQSFKDLPNFDVEVFFDITGVKI